MKTLLVSLLVASLAFVAGFYWGFVRSNHLQMEVSKRFYLQQTFAKSSQELQSVALVLNQLRNNNQAEGELMLEKWLDGSLLLADSCDRALNDGTNSYFGFAQNACEYRQKYPWTNSVPTIFSKVQTVFSQVR
jgi:hypothetical protein